MLQHEEERMLVLREIYHLVSDSTPALVELLHKLPTI